VRTTAPLVDVLTGLYAFQAASMALWGRKRGDGARHVDISLMQAAAAAQAPVIAEFGYVGKSPGTLNPPAGNYRTRDGWMAVTLVTEAHYRGICEAVGRPELATDPRFDSFASRRENLAALREALDAEILKRTTAEWEPLFAKAGALASRINTYGDWLADPHVQAVAAAPLYRVTEDTSLRVPRLPGQPAFEAPAPRIGSHTRAVLGELGMAPAAIDAWIRADIAKA
jgi:crotonobetainyl-CoA:carnitine CoA-transferase CaiB-like acyl-CoA transferase